MKILGLIIISTLLILSLCGPYLIPHSPLEINLNRRFEGPNKIYPFGTDHLGRCVLSRLIEGARRSLSSALLTQTIALFIGISIGLLSGYRGGGVDFLLMRLVDLTLAFPSLILSLALIGLIGPGLQNAMIAFALVHWAIYARFVRGLVLEIKGKQFIEAARSLGVGPFRMITHHYLPNIFSPLLILTSLDTGRVIFTLSGLSFLGLGAQPPIPDWGAMLNEGRLYLSTSPHLMLFPGLAIFIAVMGFYLLGEGMVEYKKDFSFLGTRSKNKD